MVQMLGLKWRCMLIASRLGIRICKRYTVQATAKAQPGIPTPIKDNTVEGMYATVGGGGVTYWVAALLTL
jgi:hypothetical protein